jgi:hypothetical protein
LPGADEEIFILKFFILIYGAMSYDDEMLPREITQQQSPPLCFSLLDAEWGEKCLIFRVCKSCFWGKMFRYQLLQEEPASSSPSARDEKFSILCPRKLENSRNSQKS